MRIKGVLYDVGRVMGANWRPDYSPALVHRELEIIKTGLHCTAVKICARDIGRLIAAALHMAPVTRRFVRPRMKTIPERNEDLQARCLTRQLELLDGAGVDGAFVYTFTQPLWPHAGDPEHDLDTDSFSLVKYGRPGATYPDLAWAPKKSFTAVADYYAAH